LALGTAGGVIANFITDALKSWLMPKNGKKIKAKLGDLELETSEISPSEFIILAGSLLQAKSEAEVQSKILQAGMTLTVINNFETKIYSPQSAPELQPRIDPKPTPVLDAVPQSPTQTAQRVPAQPVKKARVPSSRKHKKES
jgi:hypothetical protein